MTIAPTKPWNGPRAAVYTYVLVGDIGGSDYSGDDEQILQARRSLGELLREAQAMQAASGIADQAVLERANLFCLPSRARPGTAVDEKSYDFDLARNYRDRFRMVLASEPDLLAHLDQTGPFLVATRTPANDLLGPDAIGPAPVLLIDLSGAHPRSVPVFVDAFKRSVRRDEIAHSTLLEPLRPALASALLRLNAEIPFIKSAYASVTESPSGEGAREAGAHPH